MEEKQSKVKSSCLIIFLVMVIILLLIMISISIFDIRLIELFSGNKTNSSEICDRNGVEKIRETLQYFSQTTSEFYNGDQSSETAIHAAGNIMAYRDVLEATDVELCAEKLKDLVIETYQEDIDGYFAWASYDYAAANDHWTNVSNNFFKIDDEFQKLGYEFE
ncbi:MAG: hypothetical protein ACYDH1_17835 [Anaerolineaceae bacterium]